MNKVGHIIVTFQRIVDQVETLGLIHDREIRILHVVSTSESERRLNAEDIRRRHAESLKRLLTQFVRND